MPPRTKPFTWRGMFGTEKVTAELLTYVTTQNNAIQLFCHPSNEPYMTLSVNPAESEQLASDEVAIKDWGENVGAAEAALNAKLITGVPVRSLVSGHVVIDVYKLHSRIINLLLTKES